MVIYNANERCGIDELKKGEVFEYENEIYVLMDNIYIPSEKEKGKGKTYNVFNLRKAEIQYIHFVSDTKVFPYPYAELNLDARDFEE